MTKQQATFINEEAINLILNTTKDTKKEELLSIIEKASSAKGLTPIEAAKLLNADAPEIVSKMFETAHKIKEMIYGKRVVIFAPLYLSNYCVNSCKYCGYGCHSDIFRKKL